MARLSVRARRFLENYRVSHPNYVEASVLVRDIIARMLRESAIDIHLVSARAKTIDSLRAKLRLKQYGNPARQMTDLIGVRVITFYREDVERAIALLRRELTINPSKTVDKRGLLSVREFGYRSVHLVARFREDGIYGVINPILNRWFEIQVRSLLEHAWDEIEHEVVYKSGVSFPTETLREIAALAGALEVLEKEFGGLRTARDGLVESAKQRYATGLGMRERLDVARLLGFLELERPDGLGWRTAAGQGQPFPTGTERSSVEALATIGITTARSLRILLRSPRFRGAIRTFAARQGIEVARVSHLAVVVIASLLRDPNLVRIHFPEIAYDPAIEGLI